MESFKNRIYFIFKNKLLSSRKLLQPQAILLLLVLYIACVLAGKDYYAILGVPKSADESLVKRAYRKLAVKYHPDKVQGGEQDKQAATRKFQDIGEAYETLSDPKKKQIYDKYGEDGLKQGGMGNMRRSDPFDVLKGMFGFDDSFFGNDYQESEAQTPKGNDVVIELEATLEDLYNGRIFSVHRDKLKGVETSGTRQCNCRQKMVTQQLGPGMFQQYTKMVCDDCPNKKYVRYTEEMEVEIEPGFKEGEEIVKFGEGEPHMDGEYGDLKFIVKVAPHKKFKREGNDLHYSLNITLKDALLGFSVEILHLDNRKISVNNQEISTPGQILKLSGMGMPIYSKDFGDLYIHITVEFPQSLKNDQVECIRNNFK